MSDVATPLGGASFDGLVRVEDLGPVGQITLRGDFSSAPFRDAVTDTAGIDFPAPRCATWTPERSVLWLSPDELLLLLPYDRAAAVTAALSDRLAGEHALVANTSDTRAHLRLRGPAVREVLARLSPADLSPQALPVGELRRTKLAQVAAAFWFRTPEEAQLFCFRSVAVYAFDLLKNAAQPGTETGYF
ncbi:sarcosine oxidase subunit gamma [Salipiger sp.]|uniref:sarcosine oxidase subunit gamma n=1 Tax=Salipiger sp. TaxID=2078585 RepID=UPI003A980BDD